MKLQLTLAIALAASGCAQLGKPPQSFPRPTLETDASGATIDKAVFKKEVRARTEEIERIQYNSGQSHDRDEEPQEIARTRARISWSPAQRRIVAEFRHRPVYPYPLPAPFSFTEEIVVGECGYISGNDEFRGPKRRAMTGARIAMREKQRFVGSAYEVVLAANGSSQFEWHGEPMTVRYDADGRLANLTYLEDDPALGDVTVRVSYLDWKETELGTVEPSQIVHTVDGKLVQVDNIVSRSAEIPEALSSRCTEVDVPESADVGRARARWQMDWIGFGFPQDDAGTDPSLEVTSPTEGMHVFGGAFHNAVVIELGGDELVLIEAPFSTPRAELIFEEIEKRWPEATIVAAVQSHWHYDHSGGLRAVIARGIPIYAAPTGAEVVRDLASRSRTRLPDRLADSPRSPVIKDVPATIKGSERSIELFLTENIHASDMVTPYVPENKTIFTADLLNPELIPTRGPGGWLFRTAIKSTVPFSMIKAGTYAGALLPVLEQRDIEVIIGGHGGVGAPKDAHVLAKYGDQDKYLQMVKENEQVK